MLLREEAVAEAVAEAVTVLAEAAAAVRRMQQREVGGQPARGHACTRMHA